MKKLGEEARNCYDVSGIGVLRGLALNNAKTSGWASEK